MVYASGGDTAATPGLSHLARRTQVTSPHNAEALRRTCVSYTRVCFLPLDGSPRACFSVRRPLRLTSERRPCRQGSHQEGAWAMQGLLSSQGGRARRATAWLVTGVLLVALAGISAAPVSAATGSQAPGAPGQEGTWSPGDKDGFGTARTTASKVWYTLNDGALSEVFFPRIDTPATRDTQLAVSDGASFADREDTSTTHTTALLDGRSLVYRQVNTANSGNYRITKTYVTDPARSAVLVDIRFESLTGRPYDLYVLHDVGIGLNANDDTGRSAHGGLVATDGVQSGAVLASPGFTQRSSGYLGTSDPWSALSSDTTLDNSSTASTRGNVIPIGKTRLTGLTGSQRLTLALGFG